MLSDKREGEAHDTYDKNANSHLRDLPPSPTHEDSPLWFQILLIALVIVGIVYQCSTST